MSDHSTIDIPLNDVAVGVLRVAAARLDPAAAHEDFVTFVNTLVDDVRVEERAIALAAAVPPPVASEKRKARVVPMRSLTDEDIVEIKSRRAGLNGGRAPMGWAAEIAKDLGLTSSQVKTALYDKR